MSRVYIAILTLPVYLKRSLAKTVIFSNVSTLIECHHQGMEKITKSGIKSASMVLYKTSVSKHMNRHDCSIVVN